MGVPIRISDAGLSGSSSDVLQTIFPQKLPSAVLQAMVIMGGIPFDAQSTNLTHDTMPHLNGTRLCCDGVGTLRCRGLCSISARPAPQSRGS